MNTGKNWATYQDTSGWIHGVGWILQTWDCVGFHWQQDTIFVPGVQRWRWTVAVRTREFSFTSCSYWGWNLTVRWRWRNCGIQCSRISTLYLHSNIGSSTTVLPGICREYASEQLWSRRLENWLSTCTSALNNLINNLNNFKTHPCNNEVKIP